jgi:hypothetical protein
MSAGRHVFFKNCAQKGKLITVTQTLRQTVDLPLHILLTMNAERAFLNSLFTVSNRAASSNSVSRFCALQVATYSGSGLKCV